MPKRTPSAAKPSLKRVASAAGGAPDGTRRRVALLAGLGGALRGLRKRHALTRQALARGSGLSIRFLAQLETGQGNVSIAKLDLLARAFGLSAPALLAAAQGANDERTERGESGAESTGARAALLAAATERMLALDSARLQALLRDWNAEPAREAAPALVTLAGLRGAGKSTLGPRLAERLGLPFIELDERIAEGSGLALPEIFELHGEGYYRDAERRALAALIARGRRAVVAVSGGIVTDPEALGMLTRHTRLIWLSAQPEQHMARVEAQGDSRPMRNRPNAMAELKSLLRQRTPLYQRAHAIVDTGAGGLEATLAALERAARNSGPVDEA